MLASSQRGDEQLAFHVTVVSLDSAAHIVWDSGWVLSPNRTTMYGGEPLQPFGSYSWSVRWRSSAAGNNISSAPSAAQHFTMAPSAADWTAAEWVGGGNRVRTEIVLPSTPAAATLCAAGLGLAHPLLNGQRVSDHALGPVSQFYSRVLYVCHNVTALLHSGPNGLGLTLGSGKYGYLGLWCTADSPRECLAARYVLHVRYAAAAAAGIGDAPQQQQQLFVSQANVSTASEGPVRYDDYYQGEIYDARREQPGWSSASFT